MSVSRIVFGLYISILSGVRFVVILISLLMSPPFFNEILSLWNELVAVGLDNVANVPAVLCVKLTE